MNFKQRKQSIHIRVCRFSANEIKIQRVCLLRLLNIYINSGESTYVCMWLFTCFELLDLFSRNFLFSMLFLQRKKQSKNNKNFQVINFQKILSMRINSWCYSESTTTLFTCENTGIRHLFVKFMLKQK